MRGTELRPRRYASNSPCAQSCDKRTPGCHGSCQAYIEWRKMVDEENKKLYKYNDSKRLYKCNTGKGATAVVKANRRKHLGIEPIDTN